MLLLADDPARREMSVRAPRQTRSRRGTSWWEIRSLPSFLIEESYHLKQSPYFSIWQKADSSKSFREAEPLGGVTASEIFAISGSAPILSPILLAHDNQTITGRGIGHADLSHEKSNSAEMTSVARRLRSIQGAAAAHWGRSPPLGRLSCPAHYCCRPEHPTQAGLPSRTPIDVENQEKLPSQSQDRQT